MQAESEALVPIAVHADVIEPIWDLGKSKHAVNTSLLMASATALVGRDTTIKQAVSTIVNRTASAIANVNHHGLDPKLYECLVLAQRHRKRRAMHVDTVVLLQSFLDKSSVKRVTGVHKTADLFRKKVQAVPARLPPPPPAKYRTRPPAIPTTSPALTLARYQCARDKFTEISKLAPNGKPKNIIRADMFIAIVRRSTLAGSRTTTTFYHMVDAVDRSGPEPPVQHFHVFAVLGRLEPKLVNTVIRLQYEAPQEQYGHHPFEDHYLGPPVSVSADKLAAELGPRGDHVRIERLKVCMHWTDIASPDHTCSLRVKVFFF